MPNFKNTGNATTSSDVSLTCQKQYLVIAVLFLAIDSVWLSLVANKFYKSQIGPLLLAKPKFGPAGIFYALYVLGIQVFALSPALREDSLMYALGGGALLGLLMYATYDLTNLATLKGWKAKLVVVDMAWGAFLTRVVSAVAYVILR